jgi:hypothetical protein
MSRISALALCAVLALPIQSFAQDAANGATAPTAPAPMAPDAAAGGAAPATGDAAPAEGEAAPVAGEAPAVGAAGDVDWAQFDESLQAYADADITFNADSQIEVVALADLTEDAEGERDEYTVSIPSDPADIGAVREILAGNSVVMSAIEAAGFTIDDVSNIWVNQEGTVTIFVNSEEAGETQAPA